MLLLSFASQTSHFWQLGGVMQAKMRSLLRLLVKSIIEDRKRQADATAAREAHHSASPSVDNATRSTQDCGTLGQTHTCSVICTHANRELQRMVNSHHNTGFNIFYRRRGTHLHFFPPVKQQLEMQGEKKKSVVEPY